MPIGRRREGLYAQKNIPTKSAQACKKAWLPRTHEISRRPQDSGGSSCQRPQNTHRQRRIALSARLLSETRTAFRRRDVSYAGPTSSRSTMNGYAPVAVYSAHSSATPARVRRHGLALPLPVRRLATPSPAIAPRGCFVKRRANIGTCCLTGSKLFFSRGGQSSASARRK